MIHAFSFELFHCYRGLLNSTHLNQGLLTKLPRKTDYPLNVPELAEDSVESIRCDRILYICDSCKKNFVRSFIVLLCFLNTVAARVRHMEKLVMKVDPFLLCSANASVCLILS